LICGDGIRRFSLGLALLGAALLFGIPADTARAQDAPDCAEQATQADMNTCADLDYEEADAELNTEYQKTRKALGDWDKAADDTSRGAVAALVAAQRAWVSYRDANCEASGFQARGGSMEPMLISSCLADMSRKRADELRQLSEGF
jgi:uncharacterized protein YecT (DUF1311 family)